MTVVKMTKAERDGKGEEQAWGQMEKKSYQLHGMEKGKSRERREVVNGCATTFPLQKTRKNEANNVGEQPICENTTARPDYHMKIH